MTSDDSLSLILRRLDEIERKLDRMRDELRMMETPQPPSGIRHAGNYYLPETGETIPARMATPSPDERFHHCTYYPVANDFDPWSGPKDKPKTRCFFAPMNNW